MRDYILCYSWTDKKGRSGYGNQSLEVDEKQMSISMFEMLIADMKKRYDYKDLVIFNMIPIGEEK